MGILGRSLSRFASFAAAVTLAACGGGGGRAGADVNPGAGTITLTSISPDPIEGCDPVPFVITGTNFETVTGTTAIVTFRALGGLTPFAGGTTDRASVIADVTSDTTIEGLTPHALICGVPSVTVEVDVTLESGVKASSTGIFTLTINAPTIVSISPNPLPAAIPTPFTITGTGFGANGPVTIRFRGDNGALLFADGTQDYFDVLGEITSPTTITGVSPIATVCGPAFLTANLQLFFPDGCCTLPTANGFVTFLAPVVAGATTPVPAAIPTAMVVTGAFFGETGETGTVRFLADGGATLFSDGTSDTIDVPGVISTPGTVSLTSPLAAVCGTVSAGAAIRWIAPYGSSCRESAAGFVTFLAPTLTNVAPNPVPGAVATAITLTGTNFGPTGQNVTVRYLADSGTPFTDGTAHEIDVVGTITTPTTVVTTTPLAAVCNVASLGSAIRVIAPAGGACVQSAAGFLTFNAPVLTSFAPSPVPSAIPTAFTITGSGFGPIGSQAIVRFIADGGTTPFANATSNVFEVPGLVTSATTITGTTPLAALCGVATQGAAVRVILQDGSCRESAAAFMQFAAPTITTFSPNPFPALTPTAFTITGAGFGPTGAVAQVRFAASNPNLTPFAGGTLNAVTVFGAIVSSTTITGVTPIATTCGAPSITVTVTATLPGGSCASTGAGAVTVNGPATAGAGAFAPASVPGTTPTAFTITGTNFGPVGGIVPVRFRAQTGPATPFAHGTAAEILVTGAISSTTTITGTTPLARICTTPSVSAVDIMFPSVGCASSAVSAGTVTFTAPSITTVTGSPVPALTPTAVTMNGAGFGVVGDPVVLTLTGPLSTGFGFGTPGLSTVTIPGVVASASTLTFTTPQVTACIAASTTVSIHAEFPSGSCADGTNVLTFTPPAITAVTTPVVASTPTAITITGTNFGSLLYPLQVRFTATTGTPFAGGTSAEALVAGVVTSPTTATVTTPVATLCGTTSVTATVRATWPNLTCADSAAGALTFNGPTITSISTPTVPALVPTAFTITGTNFPLVGSNATLRFVSTSGGTPSIFSDGTATSIVLTGTVANATTITGITPAATLCGIDTATARVEAVFPDGSCAISGNTLLTYQRPSLTAASPGGISNPNLPTATFPNDNLFSHAGGEPFLLTAAAGRSFGAVGQVVEVRFSTTGNNVWQGGSRDFDTVLAQVATATTIVGTTPADVSTAAGILTVTVQAFWEDGSCSDTTTAQFVETSQRAFVTGTSVYTVAQNGTGAPSLIGSAISGVVNPAIDPHRNRLYAISGTNVNVYDTAPTMLASPVVPVQVGAGIAVGSNPQFIAVAPDKGLLWVTNGTADTISVISQSTNAVVRTVNTGAGTTPTRIFYNAPAGAMVVTLAGTSAIAVYDAAAGTLQASYAVPAVGTAVWNGVSTIRPGAGSDARAYMVYDDPTLADQIGTLQLSTGTISTVALGVGDVTGASPGALAYDTSTDVVFLWSLTSGGGLARRNAVTVAFIGGGIVGTNVTWLAYDPVDDRIYLSDTGAGTFIAVNGAVTLSFGTATVPNAGPAALTIP